MLIFCYYLFRFFVTDEYDAYIIVSFKNATLVLSIGETVEEVTDSGFLGTTPTLSCSALNDDALVQVCIINTLVDNPILFHIILFVKSKEIVLDQCREHSTRCIYHSIFGSPIHGTFN